MDLRLNNICRAPKRKTGRGAARKRNIKREDGTALCRPLSGYGLRRLPCAKDWLMVCLFYGIFIILWHMVLKAIYQCQILGYGRAGMWNSNSI
ncbi:hypothetical protein [Galbibacter marinus]|uniref:hypothetical protein n=1 Tax=Galbibacter marinus TaxID=555500 RepID=UPI0012EB0169|nr:hypothetical protein [Galbibacter marinus]